MKRPKPSPLQLKSGERRERGPTAGPYQLRYDEFGAAAGIERNGFTVLQLIAGTVRNDEAAPAMVELLNQAAAAGIDLPSPGSAES